MRSILNMILFVPVIYNFQSASCKNKMDLNQCASIIRIVIRAITCIETKISLITKIFVVFQALISNDNRFVIKCTKCSFNR